jgi:teichuronic acid biosynthesis glycosyltransferase TuaC
MLKVLTGNVDPDEVPWHINASDCLLLCSDHEGSPMIIKEAMACNLPIVVSDVGDVKERLNGVRSAFITSHDPEALADGIRAAFLSLRQGSREAIFEQGISDRQITSRMIELFQEMATRRTR